MLASWTRIERTKKPCDVCGRRRFCLRANDGAAVICTQVPSDKPIRNGFGWVHKLNGETSPVPAPRKPRAKAPDRDWLWIAMRYRSKLKNTDALAEHLGVTAEALNRLCIGWCEDWHVFTFPMRNENGAIVGIRTRRFHGGCRSIEGGRTGLFIPTDWTPSGRLYVCEGPTDCAALLSVGIEAVGRPSNLSGADMIARLFAPYDVPVTIIIDNDKPGSDAARLTRLGANDLSTMLRRQGKDVRIVQPPTEYKDAREWINRGATRADVFSKPRQRNAR